MDLADLAQWSGQVPSVKELRVPGPLKPFADYSKKGKVHLIAVRQGRGEREGSPAWALGICAPPRLPT